MNNISILGRLTNDVKHGVSQSGMAYCSFTIAHNKKIGDTDRTLFIMCKAFGKLADLINTNFRKGERILISGELAQEDYTDKSGQSVKYHCILVQGIDFIEPKQDGVGKVKQVLQTKTAPAQNQNININIDNEDLPF